MTEEEKPRFSHVTIGQNARTKATAADEELIVIGALQPLDGELGTEETRSDDPIAQGTIPDERPSAQDLAEDDLNFKMPTVQKIVFACSIVGLLIAIVLVVWFWIAQGNVA